MTNDTKFNKIALMNVSKNITVWLILGNINDNDFLLTYHHSKDNNKFWGEWVSLKEISKEEKDLVKNQFNDFINKNPENIQKIENNHNIKNEIKKLLTEWNIENITPKDKIILEVPFLEKDIVKDLGANFDNVSKKWFIYKTYTASKFDKWISQKNTEISEENDNIDENLKSEFAKLPDVIFEEVTLFKTLVLNFKNCHKKSQWIVSGHINDEKQTPFYLDYSGGYTHWKTPQRFATNLRKKILNKLREDYRRNENLLNNVTVHDYSNVINVNDLDDIIFINIEKDKVTADSELYLNNLNEISIKVTELYQKWEKEKLGFDPNNLITLNVPYAEKDEAHKLGATYYGKEKVWKIPKTFDLQVFEKWLPKENENQIDYS